MLWPSLSTALVPGHGPTSGPPNLARPGPAPDVCVGAISILAGFCNCPPQPAKRLWSAMDLCRVGGGRSQTTFKRRCVFHIHTHAQTHKHANLHTRTKTNQLPNSNTGPDDSTGPDDTTGQTPKVRDHTPRMSQPKLRDPVPTTVFWISPGPHPPVTNRHLAIRDPSSMYRARVTRPTPRRSHTRTPVVAQCTLHPYHGNREPIEPRMEPNSSSRRTQERTPGPGEIKEPGLSLTCLLPARTVVITKRDARYHRNVY